MVVKASSTQRRLLQIVHDNPNYIPTKKEAVVLRLLQNCGLVRQENGKFYLTSVGLAAAHNKQ